MKSRAQDSVGEQQPVSFLSTMQDDLNVRIWKLLDERDTESRDLHTSVVLRYYDSLG